MADTIRKADYFVADLPDKAGEAARALKGLSDAGVNLVAFTAFPSKRRSQVDFVPADGESFKAAAKRIKLKISSRKTVFIAEGDDRVGAIAEICGKLAAAGINMTAMDALSTVGGRYGAMFWVKPRDLTKAAKALGTA